MSGRAKRCYLGLDAGGTFLKAGLYDADARELAVARTESAATTPNPGWVERDMETLWRDACRVIRQAIAKAGVAPGDLAGVGISAQGKGLYLLGRDGKTPRPGILSADQRAIGLVRDWQARGLPGQIYPLTRQTLWTGHPVTLLRWLKDNEPESYANIWKVQMSHDYLRYRLTGEVGCEITNISESNLFNMSLGGYDPDLFARFGIEEAIDFMPPIVGSAEVAGRIGREAAEATGLPEGTPVVGGLFDVVATALCAGLTDDTRLNAVMGTWSIATGLADSLADRAEYNYVYGRHPDPGRYIAHDASPTSAANFEWFISSFIRDKAIDYAELNRLVSALPKAGSGVLFLPFVTGSNAGIGLKGCLYGMQTSHGLGHVVQAIYEGVVFSLNVHIGRMRKLFTRTGALRATGGPARSEPWMRILADLTGLPVELPAREETACMGAALVAAVGRGEFASVSEAAALFGKPGRVIEPDPVIQAVYLEKERRYSRLVAAVREMED